MEPNQVDSPQQPSCCETTFLCRNSGFGVLEQARATKSQEPRTPSDDAEISGKHDQEGFVTPKQPQTHSKTARHMQGTIAIRSNKQQ
mmetsp:Transcript_2222/g.5206  ORF Transcript_2222/g.5206 Transcript_2222/m.5206 type:complete len:87 (-) Transcript_2222:11-271(-)